NVVIGLTRLLRKTKLDQHQQQMMETLHANADVLLQLVNDLLDLSRIESGQIEFEHRPFTLGGILKMIETMFEKQASDKGLKLAVESNIGEGSFVGDPTRVLQILVNLVSNAIKFTPEGRIDVVAECCFHQNGREMVTVSVTDTGVGIAPEKLGSIFD